MWQGPLGTDESFAFESATWSFGKSVTSEPSIKDKNPHRYDAIAGIRRTVPALMTLILSGVVDWNPHWEFIYRVLIRMIWVWNVNYFVLLPRTSVMLP